MPPRSSAANASTTAARSANTSGWSHSTFVTTVTARPVRVEVAGVLVGLDDERRAAPPARRGRRTARDLRPEERPDERGRIRPGRRQHVDEPARGRALAVRPGDRHERPTGSGIGDDLLPRFERDAGPPRSDELGVVRGPRP